MLERSGAVRAFLSVLGPAWVVMMTDVDTPSVIKTGGSGAVFGDHLVFVLLVLIMPLFFILEAAGRLGAAPGNGLAEAVKDQYSPRMAVLAPLPTFVTDFLSYRWNRRA